MEQEIRQISFPNTVADADACFYSTKQGYTFNRTIKNGEMAHIGWFEVLKDGKVIAEIKESVCNIYY